MEPQEMHDRDRPGAPSGFGCPDCGGVLWEISEGGVPRFRCRVGHAYGIETLLAEQGDALETALWTAFRALQERAALTERMAERMGERGQGSLKERYDEQARDTRRQAELIRQVLAAGAPGAGVPNDGPSGDGASGRSAGS